MQKQVFQSPTATRWNRFIWLVRIILVFIAIGIGSLLFSLFWGSKYSVKQLTLSDKRIQAINKNNLSKKVPETEILNFTSNLKKVRLQKNTDYYKVKNVIPNDVKAYYPVRAGFYVNWDNSSASSLRENVGKLNMVLPEWFFQRDTKGNIDLKVDSQIVNLLRKNHVGIFPMLSNNVNGKWMGDSTALLLKNPKSRQNLIKNIKHSLEKYKFQGINIDLETLPRDAYRYYYKFIDELNVALGDSYLVTVDISPFDSNLDIPKIAKLFDLVFVMAYDEHFSGSAPGSVASLSFIEKSLSHVMKNADSEKFVLCTATYGYGWVKGDKTRNLSFESFMGLANSYGILPTYDSGNGDLSIAYIDEAGRECEAHCNDAVSVFNTIRTASDFGAAGVALWYLGSEDYRIWKFFDRTLSYDDLSSAPFDFNKLSHIKPMYSISYDGDGELMEVVNQPTDGETRIAIDSSNFFITNETFSKLPSSYLIKRYGKCDSKTIAITFDDGPDEKYTPEILDILKQKHVKASFFVTGINSENNIDLLKRIYAEGHEIGNHTFTHPDLEVTSEDREMIELRATRLLLETVLGHTTLLFRPPYNTDAEPENIFQIKPLSVAYKEGYVTVASSIDPNDWKKGVKADSILQRAIKNSFRGNILLLHDSGGERSQTVKILPRLIDYFKSQGYEFKLVSELMGKSRDEVMPKVKGGMLWADRMNGVFLNVTYIWQHFLKGFFFVAIILGIVRMLFLLILARKQHAKEKKFPTLPDPSYSPSVTVVVPAYNEEVNAVRTVENLLKSDYPNFNILFIDDGSKDKTYEVVKSIYGNHPKVKVLTKSNGGKASALNYGIRMATSDILVCVDADTILLPNAISEMIPYFKDGEVGAVAGNVRVGNTINLLTSWQKIEYTTSQNFDRRAFDSVNAILVVPGAIGAFRKVVMDEIGGFSTDTLAEDCDLTVRILRAGYRVRTCNSALSLTEAPEDLKMFVKQRFRWSFGMMQSFWKHRDLLFNTRKINMGWVLLPNLLIFGFIIPLFSPIVDLMFIVGLFTGSWQVYFYSYIAFFAVELLLSMMAYRYDGQKFSVKMAGQLFVQRFVYRQLLFYILLKAYLKAIKGELASWGVLKRTGNMVAVE